MSADIDLSDIQIIPVDAAVERNLFLSVVLHGESHIVDFYLLDDEQLFVVRLLFFSFFADAEDSCQRLGSGSSVTIYRTVLEDKVHLSVADEDFVHMQAFLSEQSVQRKLGDDILRPEEGIHLHSGDGVAAWILVYDYDIFEDESCEWLEVDLFESDLALDLF